MTSLWEKTWKMPAFAPLEGDRSTDVLVIGGGLAGILCAYQLRRAGVSCILAETATLCGGITRNTTAKVTSQHGLIYADLLRKFGAECARQDFDAQEAALGQYRKLCRTIDCGWEERDAYVYVRDDPRRLERELLALEKLGIPGEFAGRTPLPVPVAGAIRFPRQAQSHPLRFVSALTGGLEIYEHTAVRELSGTKAVTDRGTIRARKIIVATHFPFLNRHGGYFLKLYQHRSYVIVLENAPDVGGMYVDASPTGLSFRSYGDLLLIGGGGHRTGKPGGGWRELRAFAERHYPQAPERFHWAAQDCMSLDGVPYIGPYSASTPDLYVATGFNKWGMTSSMAAAMILCNLVRGRESPYGAVFSPSRSILRPQLAVNGLEAAVHLLTPTTRRCPHLGCALKWNPQERTWDCPCHGSRFAEDGKLLDNPATGDLGAS